MRRKRLEVLGLVQGVGFRPHVSKLASELGLVGWVRNHSGGVTIEIQGADERIDAFLDAIASRLPPLAKIDLTVVSDRCIAPQDAFDIVESLCATGAGTSVSADIAVCGDCMREFNDPLDRRYRYPFINCTNCGPRFTIVEGLPYDRARTTMKTFAMCHECQREYDDVRNRRFHAQPNACHVCGPRIWLVDSSRADVARCDHPAAGMLCGEAAVEAFHRAMVNGHIVAVKGIGGFHIACDASNDQAVERLRNRKRRGDKPLAVMMPDVEACRMVASVSPAEEELLASPQRPIVLLRKNDARDAKATPWKLAENIAPGTDVVGLMLPYSPLHALLLEHGRPLVMTSGNVSDEPIEWRNAQAVERLSHLVDAYLLHDRPIHSVCDDSVMRVVAGSVLPMRRARGIAPLPIRMPPVPAITVGGRGSRVLAVGGEIKAAFCIADSDRAYLSPHIGDLENLETLQALARNVEHLTKLFQIEPDVVVSDLHPRYYSTQWAREFANQRGLPLLQVQHHHAHLAALACEHGLPAEQPLLGICFDGTGFGSDGTIWGGEVLLVENAGFRRLAHLKSMPLPGGDESIRKPYRIALAALDAAGIAWREELPCVRACGMQERRILRQQLDRQFNCPPTSSMGRLFDAVASLIGVRQQVNYEAQAAIECESLAAALLQPGRQLARQNIRRPDRRISREATRRDSGEAVSADAFADAFSALGFSQGDYRFDCDFANGGSTIQFDYLLGAICDDVLNGVAPAVISAKFHFAIARLIADLGATFCEQLGLKQLGLSGGVFQNALLLSLACDLLRQRGIEPLVHRQVPPGDGGIALGQAWIATQLPRP